MSIQKHEFYEGAALHQLIKGADVSSVQYVAPFWVLNGKIRVYLKYSTAVRSPWGFTFGPDEQWLLHACAQQNPLFIGLICGSDGIAAVPFESYVTIAAISDSALRIACTRLHREHFEVSGPLGALARKIAPSDWKRVVGDQTTNGEML